MRAFFVACGLVAALLLSGCSGNDASSSQQPTGSDTPSASTHQGSKSSEPSASGDQSKTRKEHTSKGSDNGSKGGKADTRAEQDAAGRDGNIPSNCAISDQKVHQVVRDWDRVVGSIDRPDHGDYTGAFVERMNEVAKDAQACPGTRDLSTMRSTAQRINRQVTADGTAKLAAYGEVVDAGDGWLHKLGFENTELAVG